MRKACGSTLANVQSNVFQIAFAPTAELQAPNRVNDDG